jgi:methionyl aminopeptidase
MINIKSAEEQELMRQGGKILAAILDRLQKAVKPGVPKSDIDDLAEALCHKYNVRPSFKSYGGYPASVCISVNEEVVHGIPTGETFKEGDLVSLDMGVEWQEFHTDSAVSFVCTAYPKSSRTAEEKNSVAEDLITVCEQSFCSGIDLIKNGVHLGDVSAKIQAVAESHGYGVIRMLVGHGIGREVHEDPHVPNYGTPGTGPILKTGMTIAIEPMITADGSIDVILGDDGWTYSSQTGALCAHYEHTVLVTDDGYEILTK